MSTVPDLFADGLGGSSPKTNSPKIFKIFCWSLLTEPKLKHLT